MSLSRALSNAGQGLDAAARATNIVATNIANAQTEGFVKRSVLVTERLIDGQSAGINPLEIRRNGDALSSENVRRSDITYFQQEIIADASRDIQAEIGDIDSPFSLASRMDSFNNAMKNFSESPENPSLADETIYQANELARGIRDISQQIKTTRENADSAINTHIDLVNGYLVELGKVNGNIRAFRTGSDITGFLDEQERLVNKINEIIPVNVNFKSDNTVSLATKTGISLLDISPATIEFEPSNVITPDRIYSFAGTEPGPPYNSTLSGITVNGVDITPSANAIQSISGGKLGGYFHVRDKMSITMQRQLDTVAAQMITVFRDADNTTDTDLDLTNGDVDSLFTSTTSGASYATIDDMLGVSNAFKVNSQFDPDQGGDRSRLRDGAQATVFTTNEGNATLVRSWINGLETDQTYDVSTDLAPNQPINSAIREIVSNAKLEAQNHEQQLNFEEGRRNSFLDLRDNLQGVNIDEETQKALYFQRIYEANAVLMRTIDDMFETLLSIR